MVLRRADGAPCAEETTPPGRVGEDKDGMAVCNVSQHPGILVCAHWEIRSFRGIFVIMVVVFTKQIVQRTVINRENILTPVSLH